MSAPLQVLCCPPKERPEDGKNDPNTQHYSFACDVWSVGVMTYEMLVGSNPFGTTEVRQLAYKILHTDPRQISLPTSMSPEAKDFIMSCMHRCSDDRPVMAELMQHPFIQTYPPLILPTTAPART